LNQKGPSFLEKYYFFLTYWVEMEMWDRMTSCLSFKHAFFVGWVIVCKFHLCCISVVGIQHSKTLIIRHATDMNPNWLICSF
jgi:hypothetical protein